MYLQGFQDGLVQRIGEFVLDLVGRARLKRLALVAKNLNLLQPFQVSGAAEIERFQLDRQCRFQPGSCNAT